MKLQILVLIFGLYAGAIQANVDPFEGNFYSVGQMILHEEPQEAVERWV